MEVVAQGSAVDKVAGSRANMDIVCRVIQRSFSPPQHSFISNLCFSHSIHSVPVLAPASTAWCTGARHVIHHTKYVGACHIISLLNYVASYDVASNMCQALEGGQAVGGTLWRAVPAGANGGQGEGRGLHSFTSQLNVSTFCENCWVHDFPPVC